MRSASLAESTDTRKPLDEAHVLTAESWEAAG